MALLAACAPEVSTPPIGFLEVRAPAGQVQVDSVVVPVEAGRVARLVGIGPPPWTVTWTRDAEVVTVLAVPGPRLDLTHLLEPPPRRGPLVNLDIRPSPPARAVVLVAGDQVLPATPTADGFVGQAPRGVPTQIIAVFGEEAPVSLGRRWVDDPARTPQPLAVGPDLPLAERTAVRLESAPAAQVEGELTVGGLRTGLILGAGLAARREAVAVAVPARDAWPEAGLWIEARAYEPGERVPRVTTAAHLRLGTAEATLVWPPEGEVRPRPGPPEAAPLRTDRLRWTPGEALVTQVELVGEDGCAEPRRWRIFAPAAAGELVLPPEAILDRPLLRTSVSLLTRGDATWAELLDGTAAPAVRWPRTLGLVAERRAVGFVRGGDVCDGDPRQGRYVLVEVPECTEESPRSVVVDRCGRLLPEDGDSDLCGATADDLVPTDGGLALGEARLVAPALPPGPAPGVLQGDYFRIEVWRQRRAATTAGTPGDPLEASVRIEAGDSATGPFARITPEGRVVVRGQRVRLDGALERFDGLAGTLALDGCGEALPFTFDGEAWVITRWRLTEAGAGELLEVHLRRR